MKQPLVECDLLVEVLNNLTAKKGDFLIVYYTDPERRRAVAVRTFQAHTNGAAEKAVTQRLAKPPPNKRSKRAPKPTVKPLPRKLANVRFSRASLIERRRKEIFAQGESAIDWGRALGLGPTSTKFSIRNNIRQIIFDAAGDFITQRSLMSKSLTSSSNVVNAVEGPLRQEWFKKTEQDGRIGYALTPHGAAHLDSFRRSPPTSSAAPGPAPAEPASAEP